MQAFRIVGLGLVAAIAYGIAHDQVTARVCVEYFTIGHPKVIESQSPTLLALVWGVRATWWVGLPLGVLLALAARLGRRPRLDAHRLVGPVAALLGIMGACAALSGALGHGLARMDLVVLLGDLAERVPADRHDAYLADMWAHVASYVVGALGGLVLVVRTWLVRGRQTGGAS